MATTVPMPPDFGKSIYKNEFYEKEKLYLIQDRDHFMIDILFSNQQSYGDFGFYDTLLNLNECDEREFLSPLHAQKLERSYYIGTDHGDCRLWYDPVDGSIGASDDDDEMKFCFNAFDNKLELLEAWFKYEALFEESEELKKIMKGDDQDEKNYYTGFIKHAVHGGRIPGKGEDNFFTKLWRTKVQKNRVKTLSTADGQYY